MAQNEGASTGVSEQAVSIRIKMKWHKIKECHLKQVNKLCQLGSR